MPPVSNPDDTDNDFTESGIILTISENDTSACSSEGCSSQIEQNEYSSQAKVSEFNFDNGGNQQTPECQTPQTSITTPHKHVNRNLNVI